MKKLSDMSITEMLASAEDGMNLFIEEADHAGDEWDESKHKRDAEGKFTSGGGAKKGGAEGGSSESKVLKYAQKMKKEYGNIGGETLEQMIYKKYGWSGVEELRKSSEHTPPASKYDYTNDTDLDSTKTNGTDGISAAPEDKESIKMDKRKVIEEIMAIAAKPADKFKDGKEEQIRTIAGLAEKLAYNKSERGANDEDAAKDKDKAKDEDNPSNTDKDADKKAKESCDKADKAEDAMEARIAANFAKKASLYEKISPFIGTFDHNPMTLSQMAKYACDKLGIKGIAEDGAETALIGYLAGAKKQAVVRQVKGASLDAAPESDAAFENYLKEAE